LLETNFKVVGCLCPKADLGHLSLTCVAARLKHRVAALSGNIALQQLGSIALQQFWETSMHVGKHRGNVAARQPSEMSRRDLITADPVFRHRVSLDLL
jgi:hypothetical protein